MSHMQSPDEYLRRIEDEHLAQDAHNQNQKPSRSPWRWLKRLLIAIIILVVGALIFVAWFGLHTLQGVSEHPYDLSGLQADTGGRTNILVLGVGDPGHAGQDLSDTIMVFSLNRSTKQVATISIPRDTRVSIPGYEYRKINNAYALGGASLAQETVGNMLDIPIHYYMVTNFTGLSKLVDAVGGLDINVKEALVDDQYPCADNQYKACGINIQPGQQHMDGARVLEYTRCRKGTCGNDFGRAARQQEVIGLLMVKLTQPSTWLSPVSATAVSNALRQGIKTDLSGPNMVRVAWFWMHKVGDPISWVLSTAPGGMLRNGGGSDLVPTAGNFTEIAQQAQNIFVSPPAKVVN